MHSSVVRVQNVFGYFTSVAFAVATAIAISVLLIPQAPSASLKLKNVKVARGRPHYYSVKREEYAHVTFDLDADLSSLFNWNTKQIFVYITASYPSNTPSSVPPSEAVIWDAIIPADSAPWHSNTYIHPGSKAAASAKKQPKKTANSKTSSSAAARKRAAGGKPYPDGGKPGIVRLAGQRPKYQITDVSGKIAERGDAVLTLHWNVQPWVGALTWTNRAPLGRWAGLRGGRSEPFAFPAIKSSETVKSDELKTVKGAERNRGSPA